MARQGALRRLDAVGSGAPVARPVAHLDRAARRGRARAHPGGGAHREQPQPDRPGGPIPTRGPPRPWRSSPAWSPSSGRSRRWLASRARTPMHIKFLARGTGSVRDAVDYLLGERDATGQPREGVEVLRGKPDMVAALADSLDFEHRYTSGVIAWAADDQPTDEHIEAVVDEFEETAWAGLEPDRYAWTAVLHREKGRRRACPCTRGAVRSGDRPKPQHRAPRLAEDVRPAPRRLQPRTRLEPSRRSAAGQGGAARPPRVHRGGAAAGRAPARIVPPRPDPGLRAPARRARNGAEWRRSRCRTAGGGPRSAAPGQGLPHGAGPRDRGPLAAERRTVWRELRPRTI